MSQRESLPDGASLLRQLLVDLEKSEGLSQKDVAERVGVKPQFLSDVKHGRRPLTLSFTHRLLSNLGSRAALGLGPSLQAMGLRPRAQGDGAQSPVQLPVLVKPWQGAPTSSPDWDGSQVELSAAAARLAALAQEPYVLRITQDDVTGRLRTGDLVLVVQQANDDAMHVLVATSDGLVLGIRTDDGAIHDMATNEALPADVAVVAYMAAIVYGRM